MKRKKVILLSVPVLLLLSGWYGYSEYNRRNKDMSAVTVDLSVTATDLIKKFEADETAADKFFLTKKEFIVEVKGNVKEVKKDEKGYYTIVLGDTTTMSSVRCSMDTTHQDEATAIKAGNAVIVHGAITGFNKDELLGSDVILNRCVIYKSN